MSGSLEALIAVVGIIIFTMVFAAGVFYLQGQDDRFIARESSAEPPDTPRTP
jgi:hypothetical protein